jgi:tetrahydromethanopterin S-methyltransferase subunit A
MVGVEPAKGWPIVAGEFIASDPKAPVAVCLLSSESLLREVASIPGVAIAGPCKTENIGVEKIVANIVSNPNIRFLLVCGVEVTGHVTGGTIEALWRNGVDESKRIRNAPGAIPFVEHLTSEAIERFRSQVELVSLINVEDLKVIRKTVEDLVSRNPGPYPAEPLIVKVEEAAAKPTTVKIPLAGSVNPMVDSVQQLLEDIRYRVQVLGRTLRLVNAVTSLRGLGISIGILISLIIYITLLLAIIWW